MLSIIVPVYNGSDYINANFNSLEKQTIKDFEVIYIDDGSTDNSLDILLSLKSESFKIKIIQKENGGVSSARNIGLEHAEGDFISFLDVDDELMPDFAEYMISLAEKWQADIVICSVIHSKNAAEKERYNEIIKTYSCDEALNAYLFKSIRNKTCIIRLNDEMKVLRFREGYKYGEDVEMFWKFLSCSNKVVYSSRKLYIYNLNYGSATSKFNMERLQAVKLMKDLRIYFFQKNMNFANTYNKYCVPRIWWSLLWQSAIMLPEKEYKNFYIQNKIKKEIKNLLSSKEFIVAISTAFFLITPMFFRIIIKIINKDKVTKYT